MMLSRILRSLHETFLPFLRWGHDVKRDTLRPDIEAGIIGAILILPQSIALATLAGMPPEYGVYTSIFPVIIASFWGSSYHTLSGPNTAVCVLIAYSVAPFASIGNEYYVGYALALTFMVGVISLVVGLMRLGAVLDFISQTVIVAIVQAVALVIIVSAGSSFLGVLSNLEDPFLIKIYQFVHDIARANPYAVLVGTVTVASGFIAKRFFKRYALVIAVITGSVFSYLLNLALGSAYTGVEVIGTLSISLLPFSTPTFDLEALYVLKELISGAFAITFLGLMQTVVISRALAVRSGQQIDTNQEIIGQGLSNLVAPFLSSFASSGSFNRSAAHFDAGAKTPMAALYASLILGIIVYFGSSVIAYIPLPAVAGALILVGHGLIDIKGAKEIFKSRLEGTIFLFTFLVALGFGLNAGVFTGLLLSLIIYLWFASTPNIEIEKHTARDGRPVSVITVDGNLFFGSVRHVEKALSHIDDSRYDNGLLLYRTDHMTYLDIPGAELLTMDAKHRRSNGDDVYLYITRSNVLNVLERSGALEVFGKDHVIHKGKPHPVMDIIYPGRTSPGKVIWNSRVNDKNPGEETMESIATRLKSTKLLGKLTTDQLLTLINDGGILTAESGDILTMEEQAMHDHIILLDGELEAQRLWTTDEGKTKSFTWSLIPNEDQSGFAFLPAANRIRARAVTDIRYIEINADTVDKLIGWSQQLESSYEDEPELKQRAMLIRHVSVFHDLPIENIHQAFARMKPLDVEAGQNVVTQGEKGDLYYLIESGEAKVMRADPFTDEVSEAAILGAGDAFGEEALLQDASRNATVVMTTPGRLLTLDKSDFDELVQPSMIEEISAEQAHEMIQQGKAEWLDVRYDMEYEESRIPDAPLISLDVLRDNVHKLDPNITYILYCRSGRRSKAATFILRERNIKACSMNGGIRDWPYEIDSSPMDLS